MTHNMHVAVNAVAESDETEQQEKENCPRSPAPFQFFFFFFKAKSIKHCLHLLPSHSLPKLSTQIFIPISLEAALDKITRDFHLV